MRGWAQLGSETKSKFKLGLAQASFEFAKAELGFGSGEIKILSLTSDLIRIKLDLLVQF